MEIVHEDLALDGISMRRAIEADQLDEPQEQESPSYRLYVGLP